MNLSNETLSILNNFSTIQPNMLFQAGNVVKTIAEGKNIVAKATISETIPQSFGIYDLKDFLSSLALFTTPAFEINSDGKSVKISQDKSSLTYFFSDEESLTYPKKEVAMPPTDVSFVLTAETLRSLQKACSLLNVSTVSVENTASGVSISVKDPKNSTSNSFGTEVEGSNNGHTFKFHFDITNFKLVPGDYDVQISGKLISHFQHKSMPIEYWIALEKTSTYEE